MKEKPTLIDGPGSMAAFAAAAGRAFEPDPASAPVHAIIVTYNPVIAHVQQLCASIAGQVAKIIVVDNDSANADNLAAAFRACDAVALIRLPKNMGIAYAQNAGVAAAKNGGAQYLVYFDQDSSVPASFVDTLKQAFIALSAKHKVAATVPILKDSRHGFFYPLIQMRAFGLRRKIVPTGLEHQPFAISLAISSGTFTSVAVTNDVGDMRSDFFIDYVDTEWCLRAIHKGYSLYAVPAVCMLHAIGDKSIPLFKWRLVVHSAFRRYYRVRNAFFMLRLAHVPLLLGVREIVVNSIHQLILFATQEHKLLTIKSFATAVRHGLAQYKGV
jgi:rhamnosyltransferase